jgi:hypothetical protein
MWLIKQSALIALLVVVMAAWNVPAMDTWGFWIGLLAFALFAGCIENGR